ncbi:MAG: hypothetical protein GEU73_01415, partial [Chloroflexi bacterium]|nr:hypothetical protein [Chloroflexota bacterium]
MAVTVEKHTDVWPHGTGTPATEPHPTAPDAPNLGRTVRVIGPVANVDMNESPHPKNARGELGKA